MREDYYCYLNPMKIEDGRTKRTIIMVIKEETKQSNWSTRNEILVNGKQARSKNLQQTCICQLAGSIVERISNLSLPSYAEDEPYNFGVEVYWHWYTKFIDDNKSY